MRKLAIAVALASTAIATPAIARDNSFYLGVEGGLMVVEDTNLDYDNGVIAVNNGFIMNHKVGFDVDVLGGYDLGWVRLEGEIAYKHANLDDTKVEAALSQPTPGITFDTDGDVSVLTGMVNGLLDFGDEESGWAGYVGAGVGLAKVKYDQDIVLTGLDFSNSDGSFAWQGIAGVRYGISSNMDLGLKYRFLNVSNLDLSEGVVDLHGRLRSHSLLVSLLWNLGVEPPPPPPPATQTCPDGSVILATDACPVPPPPPPPPPPEPVRG